MAKDIGSTKNSVALLAKVFEFVNELDEKQISNFLDGKSKLSLDAPIDGQLDALIEARLNAKVDERLGALIDEKLKAKSTEAAAPSVFDGVDLQKYNTLLYPKSRSVADASSDTDAKPVDKPKRKYNRKNKAEDAAAGEATTDKALKSGKSKKSTVAKSTVTKSETTKPSMKPPTEKAAINKPSDKDLDEIASALKKAKSREDIVDYFEKNPIFVGTMKKLANKYFDVPGTNVKNKEELMTNIYEVVQRLNA